MKNVQQVFVGIQGNAATAVGIAAVAPGDFVVLDGGANTTVATIGNVLAPFFHFGIGTADGTIVSDSFPAGVFSRAHQLLLMLLQQIRNFLLK